MVGIQNMHLLQFLRSTFTAYESGGKSTDHLHNFMTTFAFNHIWWFPEIPPSRNEEYPGMVIACKALRDRIKIDWDYQGLHNILSTWMSALNVHFHLTWSASDVVYNETSIMPQMTITWGNDFKRVNTNMIRDYNAPAATGWNDFGVKHLCSILWLKFTYWLSVRGWPMPTQTEMFL